jgi:signal peptide peptidase SppA
MPDTQTVLDRAREAGVPPLLLSGSPWALRRDMLAQVMQAARFPDHAGGTIRVAAAAPERTMRGVATIPLTGVITPHGSFLDFLFGGGGGLVGFTELFDEAMASEEVNAIVIDVDSPGGLVDLVPETAQHIREARGQGKPIVAVADTLMASAAYWIAAQADEIVVTPSGYAGSIGVYRVHVDASGLNEQLGLKVTYVSAGEYKTEGNSDAPLSDEAEADWQQAVDDAYGLFVDDVAAGRGVTAATVLADYGQGRVMNAKRALSAGLVDRVDTYDTVIGKLLGASATVDTGIAAQLAEVQSALERAEAQIAELSASAVLDDETPVLSAEDRREIAAILAR